jgi:outer membrane autotransporter protein
MAEARVALPAVPVRGGAVGPLLLCTASIALLAAIDVAPALAADFTITTAVTGGNGATGDATDGGAGGLAGMGAGQGGAGGNGGAGQVGTAGTAGAAGTGGGSGGGYNEVPGGATGGGGAGADSGAFGAGMGGGGGGGSGMSYAGNQNITVTSTGSVSGGDGALGGVGHRRNAGSPGGGGDGITLISSDNSVITVAAGATVKGGKGVGGSVGNPSQGGNGIALQGNGGTIVVAGTVAGGGQVLLGDLNPEALNNAIVLIGNANRVELRAGGVITGKVIATGSNNWLTLGGDNDASFDASTLGTQYQGLDLNKSGNSTWTLTGDRASFTGITTVSGGKLVVNGGLGGTIQVASGGRLGGTGTLGTIGSTVTITAGGVHAPANSIGTQIIAGNYVNHGTLSVEAEPTAADKLVVAGTVDISGATLELLLSPSTAASWNILNGPFTLIDKQSAGAVTGMFGAVTQNLLFLDTTLDYAGGDGNDVTLALQRNDVAFADLGITPNQVATAAAIDTLGSGSPVWTSIALTGDEDVVRASFEALSGEIHASLRSALIEDSRFVRDAMNDRLRNAFEPAAATYTPVLSYAASETPMLVESDYSGPSLWIDGFGAWGSIDSDGNAAALERSTGGLLVGLDAPVGDWRVGLLAGYGQSDASSATSANYHLGIYAGAEWDKLAFRSGLAYGRHDIDSTRDVVIPGITETLTANYGTNTVQAFGEFAYGLDVGTTRISPFANLAHINLSNEAFRETGGDAALSVAGTTTDVTFTTLGVRVEHAVNLGEIDGTLSGMLGWRHAFGDTTPTSAHAFAGSESFLISGVPIATDALVVEGGLDLNLGPGATLGLSYAGQLAASSRDHALKARLGVAF